MAGLRTIYEQEKVLLAPYAVHSSDSRGRRHVEPEHPYRGPFQRDRDRIVHSAAFRRLSGKMQVFTKDMGDYHRTRLTHTHEVASIARTIGRALRLNEDFIEALALFHDIGHPPYGHAGEDVLDQCLEDAGGFSHNLHALTIAEELEIRYTQFPGLNLSREVLEGQRMRNDKSTLQQACLEVQVVDVADSITYDAHDTDDAVKLGLVSLEDLAQLDLIAEMLENVRWRFGRLNSDLTRQALVHELIDVQVGDVLRSAGQCLVNGPWDSSESARQSTFRLTPTPALREKKEKLERFLYTEVYRHPKVMDVRACAQDRLRTLFHTLVAQPNRLPARFRQRARMVGGKRSVADYLAGMTDRFCERTFKQLTYEKAIK